MNSGPAFKATVKIYCLAGNAKPSPKIGQALGPLGINMMQFCKEFNDRTQEFNPDVPMRVLLNAYVDRSFKFVIKPTTVTDHPSLRNLILYWNRSGNTLHGCPTNL